MCCVKNDDAVDIGRAAVIGIVGSLVVMAVIAVFVTESQETISRLILWGLGGLVSVSVVTLSIMALFAVLDIRRQLRRAVDLLERIEKHRPSNQVAAGTDICRQSADDRGIYKLD